MINTAADYEIGIEVCVAVGSTLAGVPRTDPYVKDYLIRLLARVERAHSTDDVRRGLVAR
jgi:hypothetical protein